MTNKDEIIKEYTNSTEAFRNIQMINTSGRTSNELFEINKLYADAANRMFKATSEYKKLLEVDE